MSYSLTVHHAAVLEMQETFEWYQSAKPGLGFEFLDEIEIGFTKIRTSPHHYSSINKHLRKYLLTRFPYIIVFEIEDNTVIINSVVHTKRDKAANP